MIANEWLQYDRPPGSKQNSRVVRAVKDKDGQHERWVIFHTIGDHTTRIDNIEQPDPERQALSGLQRLDGGINYTYADELSRKITLGIVLTVICSILTTPVALLCFIPMILHLRKAEQEAAKGSLPAARKNYYLAGADLCCAIVWIVLMLGLFFATALSLALTFGIVFGRQSS